jgi:RNA polymerase sigma factor (sigma-70 family)
MMTPNPFPRLLQSAGESVPDAFLLGRYVVDRDHAAFELLVRRHADAVWTACRCILRHHADAEDAFQSTFLALAKKAGSIRETGTLGGWLYRVAVNAALKLRQQRPDREGGLPKALPLGRASEGIVDSPAHEELARLPEKYRLPVVLCDLEGYSHAEAAAVLGWPVGTVSGRLSRARDKLRTRLLRRGIVGPVVLTAVTADSSLAGRATAIALGMVSVSPVVSSLTEGVLATMTTMKWKLTVVVAAGLVCVGGVGTYVAMGQSPAKTDSKQQPAATNGQPNEPVDRKVQKLKGGRITAYPELIDDSGNDYKMPDAKIIGKLVEDPGNIPATDLRQLYVERLRRLKETIRLDTEVVRIGTWDVPFLNQYLRNVENLASAAKAALPQPADHIPWLRLCVAEVGRFQFVVFQRVYVANNLRDQQYYQTDAFRLRLESELHEAEVAAKKVAPPAGGR